MHVYEDKDGRLVIDMEGDLIIYGHKVIRSDAFSKSKYTVTNGVFIANRDDSTRRQKLRTIFGIVRQSFALRKRIKELEERNAILTAQLAAADEQIKFAFERLQSLRNSTFKEVK